MIIKKIFTLVIIANIGLIQAQYTAIPNGCFEFYLITAGIDSEGTHDGQVLTSDINSIINLEVFPDGCMVSDLTGIEDFTALEYLDVSHNYLTNIDISQNLQLKELYCNSNQLTSIDISNNLVLKKLVCSVNQISTFISGNNSNLEFLRLVNNNLTSLDTSNFSNLKTLFCTLNQLEQINLTQNINLERLSFSLNNQLNFLDLRNGNNNLITYFPNTETPNLTCIFVDNADYSTVNWLDIDPNSTFVETETECNTLTIDSFLIKKFNVYPNPTKDILNIENLDNIKINSINIFDILGKQILNITHNLTTINLSHLNNGLYVVKINTEKGTFNKKIIKL